MVWSRRLIEALVELACSIPFLSAEVAAALELFELRAFTSATLDVVGWTVVNGARSWFVKTDPSSFDGSDAVPLGGILLPFTSSLRELGGSRTQWSRWERIASLLCRCELCVCLHQMVPFGEVAAKGANLVRQLAGDRLLVESDSLVDDAFDAFVERRGLIVRPFGPSSVGSRSNEVDSEVAHPPSSGSSSLASCSDGEKSFAPLGVSALRWRLLTYTAPFLVDH